VFVDNNRANTGELQYRYRARRVAKKLETLSTTRKTEYIVFKYNEANPGLGLHVRRRSHADITRYMT